MPDIAMCLNATCPSKSTCYRAMARPSDNQGYMHFVANESGRCGSYMNALHRREDAKGPETSTAPYSTPQ